MLDDRTWLLIGRKMAHEASPQELKELENILRSNPELHFPLQTLSDLWQQAPTEDYHELEAAYNAHLVKMNLSGSALPGDNEDDFMQNASIVTYKQKFLQGKRGVAALVVSAIILVAAWFAIPVKNKPIAVKDSAGSEISTRYGSKTNIVLPDGSKVWLNSGSKLTYDKDFGEQVREVRLTGEAYFDVQHNKAKPFIIHTRAMDIKVLGTEFNVKSYPDEKTTETSLIKGSIEVTLNDKRAEKILLKPNEKLVVSNEQEDGPGVKSKRKSKDRKSDTPIIRLGSLNYFSLDSSILETTWVENRLVFEDESFSEISMRMSRWYGVDFVFNDEAITKLRFTGNFKDESLEDALRAMQITADFRFNILDKHVTITKH